MLMGAGFPIPVGPGIVAEIGRISQLGLGDASAVTLEPCVVLQRRPGYRIVTVLPDRESHRSS